MSEQFIKTSIADGVMTIRIDRAEKKNALTADMYGQIAAGLDEAKTNDDVRCILILGVPGSFTAGNDIADFLKVATTGERTSNSVIDFLIRLVEAPKPMVAGVDGLAIGVGSTMLFHCDYVVAAQGSTFKAPFVDLGIIPEAGSTLLLPKLTSHQTAFAFLAGIDEFSPEDAHNAGFVQRIVSSEELENEALSVARQIAAKPVGGLKITRDLIRGDRSAVADRMREESEIFAERLTSDEAKQAFMSFFAKG